MIIKKFKEENGMDYISNNKQPISVKQVYRSIRDRILNLDLEPGQKISENQK